MTQADKSADSVAETDKEPDENRKDSSVDLSYDKSFYRIDESCRYMEEIHQMAVSGKTISGAMGTASALRRFSSVTLYLLGMYSNMYLYAASRSSGRIPPSPLHMAVFAIAEPFARETLISLDNAPKDMWETYTGFSRIIGFLACLPITSRSDGRPIGIKIAAGRIERDLEYCVYAEPDFITIDGRGGATGSGNLPPSAPPAPP